MDDMTLMPRISILLPDSHNHPNPYANQWLWQSVKIIDILSGFCCEEGKEEGKPSSRDDDHELCKTGKRLLWSQKDTRVVP